MTVRPTVGVGCLVRAPGGLLLVGHRVKRGEPPCWCLPGGHMEIGETFEDAAVREVIEESGVRANAPRVFVVVTQLGGGVTAGVVADAANTETRITEPLVFDQWTWAPPDRLPGPLFPASAALIDAWLGRPTRPGWSSYPIVGGSGG